MLIYISDLHGNIGALRYQGTRPGRGARSRKSYNQVLPIHMQM